MLQDGIATAETANRNIEETHRLMEDAYDKAAEEIQSLPIAECRAFLESRRTYLEDDPDDVDLIIKHFETKELHPEP